MGVEKEQQMNAEFCFILGKNIVETDEMPVRVYGDVTIINKMVFKWFQCFYDGQKSVDEWASLCVGN